MAGKRRRFNEGSYKDHMRANHGIDVDTVAFAASSVSIEAAQQSQEFQKLVEMVLQGEMSASCAQQIAASSCADGERPSEMQYLASLGNHGNSPQHCWGQLKDKLGLENCCFPEGLKLLVPVKDLKARPPAPRVVWVEWEMLLLQDVLHCLFYNNRAEFNRRFLGGDAARIPAYWAQAKTEDDPRISSHPMRQADNWKQRAIPARLHGDGVPFGKGRLASLDVVNVTSLLAIGAVLDIINLWFAFPKQILCKLAVDGYDTMSYFWQAAIWDLWTCLTGVFAHRDWLGKEIGPGHQRWGKVGEVMGGLLLAMLQVGTDTDYLSNNLGLPHWQNLDPCGWCNCDSRNGSDNLFSDFREGSCHNFKPCIHTSAWHEQDQTLHLYMFAQHVELDKSQLA